jgi:ATPase subunit of ABC transporter with duplicated ATPase domains
VNPQANVQNHPGPVATAKLHADAVTLGYGDRTVVSDLTVSLPEGRVTVIVGANACGKSTLLRPRRPRTPHQAARA